MIQLHKEDQISGKTLMQHIKDPNRLKDYLIKMREKQAEIENEKLNTVHT